MKVIWNKCDICGVCASVCPVDAVTISEHKVEINNMKCIDCNKCLIVCPAMAIVRGFENNSPKEDETTIDLTLLPNIEKEYDVIVVGAGPGGSVTARFSAENNLSTLILERDREAGIPVRCAEGISGGGLDAFINIDERFISSRIRKARLYTPDGNHLDMRSKVEGYVLERRVFDSALCDIACQKGAEMLTKADVTGIKKTSDGKMKVFFTYKGLQRYVTCKIVIGADGVESRVGRWAGIDTTLKLNDISSSTQYRINNIQLDSEMISFYFGNKIAPGGYVWVFHKSSNSANVGIGITGNFAQNKPAQDYLDEFIKIHFPEASISYTVYSGVPIANTLDKIVADNVMLVGDAARQVNPVTGGGIKQAMVAGKIAGEVAAEAILKNDYSTKILKKYSQEWERVLGSKHRFMYKIKEKVLNAPDERLNKISNICKGLPAEDISLTYLFKAVVKGDPKLVAEMATAFVLSKISI